MRQFAIVDLADALVYVTEIHEFEKKRDCAKAKD